MKAKLYILTLVLLLGAAPAFADTYSIEAFETSRPNIADSVVQDRADTIGQIGHEQAWYCFDITEIPDSERYGTTRTTTGFSPGLTTRMKKLLKRQPS